MKSAALKAACLLPALALAVAAAYGWESVLARRASEVPADDGGETLTYGIRVRRNRFGFRDDDLSVPKPTGVYRIVVLGDSFTFGAGLAEGDRYTNLLGSLLRAEFPKRRIEVVNAGMSGGPTTWERDWLHDHVDEIQPDCIVIGFCINDPKERDAGWSPEQDRWVERLKWMETIGLNKLRRHLVVNTLPSLGAMPNMFAALDRSYSDDSADWRGFTKALNDIEQLCRQRKIPAFFLSLLYENGDYNSPNEPIRYILKWTAQAEDAARNASLGVLSVEPQFRAEGDRVRWVNRWDAHPDAKCNRIYAEELAKAIAPIIKGNKQKKTKETKRAAAE